MMKLVIQVYLYDSFYAVYRVTKRKATLVDVDRPIETHKIDPKTQYAADADAYFHRPFFGDVFRSAAYRTNLLHYSWASIGYPSCETIYLNLRLKPPDQEIIDYLWNERMLRFVWRHVEIENALFWLSTLGGAFSALGDYFEHCAEMAGKISFRQLELSLQLGDEGLAARSRLYFSLALAQKGQLRTARRMVRSVADFARSSLDRRLMRMCQGVWAKLRYLRQLESGKLERLELNGRKSEVCRKENTVVNSRSKP